MPKKNDPQRILDSMAENLPEVDLDELTDGASVEGLTGQPAAKAWQNGNVVVVVDDPEVHSHNGHRIFSSVRGQGKVEFDEPSAEIYDHAEEPRDVTADEMHDEINELLDAHNRPDLRP